MPTIPTYDSAQVSAAPLPGARQESVVSPTLLNAGAEQQIQAGKALLSAGKDVADIGARMQHEADLAAVQKALADYNEGAQNFQLNARETRTGRAAQGVVQDFDAWHNENANKILGSLTEERQRQAFIAQAGRSRLAIRHDMGTFQVSETAKANDLAFDASVSNLVNAGAIAVTESAAAIFKDQLKQNITAYAATRNVDPEVEKQLMGKALTNFNLNRIQNLVNQSPALAREYFTANKAEIDGAHWDDVEKLLKIGTTREVAQRTAAELAAKGLTEADGLTWIRENLKGEEQDAAASQWKMVLGEQRQAREGSQKDAADTAWKTYSETNNIAAVPTSVVQRMDGKTWLALQDYAQKKAAGESIPTNPFVYLKLTEMMRDNLAGFLRTDLSQYINQLSPKALHHFADAQTHPERIEEIRALGAQLADAHDRMGWSSDDKNKMGVFDEAVSTELARQAAQGKRLNYLERKELIDRMLLEGEVLSGHWYLNDPNKRVFQVYGTPEAERFAPKVPDIDREQITDAIKRDKRPVTEEEIQRRYAKDRGL